MKKNIVPLTLLDVIKKGYFQQVRFLVEHGVNIDQRDDERRTSLMLCAFVEPEKWGIGIARLLIENGASLDYRDKYGLTAFHYACVYERVELTRVYLKAIDFDLIQGDKLGNTGLHYAAKAGNLNIVRLISQAYLKYKITFDKRNNEGYTALNEAYRSDSRKCIRLLESPGVLADIGNIDANLPLDLKSVEVDNDVPSIRSYRKSTARPHSSVLSRRSSRSSILTTSEYTYRRSPTIYSYDPHRDRGRRMDINIEIQPYEKNQKMLIRCASLSDCRNNPEYLFHMTPIEAVTDHDDVQPQPPKRARAKSAFVRRSEVNDHEARENGFSWRTEFRKLYANFQYQCSQSYRNSVDNSDKTYLPFLDKPPPTPTASEHGLDEDKGRKSRIRSAAPTRQNTQETLTAGKGKPPLPTQSKTRKLAPSVDGSLESSSESINSSASSRKQAGEKGSKSVKDSTGRTSRTANYKGAPVVNLEEPPTGNPDADSLVPQDSRLLNVIDE